MEYTPLTSPHGNFDRKKYGKPYSIHQILECSAKFSDRALAGEPVHIPSNNETWQWNIYHLLIYTF